MTRPMSDARRRAAHLCLVTEDFKPRRHSIQSKLSRDELTFMAEEAAIAHEAVGRALLAIDDGDLEQAGSLVRKARAETKSLCNITQGALRF